MTAAQQDRRGFDNNNRSDTMEQQKQYIQQYILDCINSDDRGIDPQPETNKDKLQFLFDTFKSEAVYPGALKRYGTLQNIFKEWIAGLHTALDIEFSNYGILQLAKKQGSLPDNPTDNQCYKITSNYWNYIAANTFQLFSKYNILTNLNK